MRLTITALALALLCAGVHAEEAGAAAKPTYASVLAAHSKYIKNGIKISFKYFQQEALLGIGKKGASLTKVEKEREKWRAWLDGSKKAIGIDLYAHPRIVIEVLEHGRYAVIDRMVSLKRGQLVYGGRDAPGYSRGAVEYTVLVPKAYDPVKMEKSPPLVITMHGRAINLRHPSLRKAPNERSRIVVWNNWLGSKKVPNQMAVVLAPTGRPEGFSYAKAPEFSRQTLFLGMNVGHTDYRTDPLGTFVEVYGDMIQIAAEYSTLFAGIIWRDRKDQQKAPVSADHTMIFDNLNGRPLYYVADKKIWNKVGKPMSEALTTAYKAAGKLDNLIVEQVDRDANGALRADPEKLAKFLEHRLSMPLREFKWLFWHPNLVGPLPMLLTRADYTYDATEKIAAMPLRDRCGTIDFKASIEVIDGKPVNLFDLKITEAQSAKIFLYEHLVDLDLPITVKVNGNVVLENEKVKRDWGLFEKFCMQRRFFIYPVVGQIDFQFPVQPRVVPEPVKKEGEEGAEGAKDGDAKDAAEK